jgi:class 3 adenylate cyclase
VNAPELPSGQVTFLFTDIAGSTKLNLDLGPLGPLYGNVLKQYHQIVAAEVSAHRGVLIQTQGDGCFAAFADASDGVAAAVTCQLELAERGPDTKGNPSRSAWGCTPAERFPQTVITTRLPSIAQLGCQ